MQGKVLIIYNFLHYPSLCLESISRALTLTVTDTDILIHLKFIFPCVLWSLNCLWEYQNQGRTIQSSSAKNKGKNRSPYSDRKINNNTILIRRTVANLFNNKIIFKFFNLRKNYNKCKGKNRLDSNKKLLRKIKGDWRRMTQPTVKDQTEWEESKTLKKYIVALNKTCRHDRERFFPFYYRPRNEDTLWAKSFKLHWN